MLQFLVAADECRTWAEDAWHEKVWGNSLAMWERQEANMETLVAAYNRASDVVS